MKKIIITSVARFCITGAWNSHPMVILISHILTPEILCWSFHLNSNKHIFLFLLPSYVLKGRRGEERKGERGCLCYTAVTLQDNGNELDNGRTQGWGPSTSFMPCPMAVTWTDCATYLLLPCSLRTLFLSFTCLLRPRQDVKYFSWPFIFSLFLLLPRILQLQRIMIKMTVIKMTMMMM